MGELTSSVRNRCMKLFSMTRMLGTVNDIGVNRSQTLAFGTLQGECMLSQTLILPHKSKVKTANEIFSIGISR
ncbi:hypothetical protein Bca4012_029295 [Brassica carinata]|nr:unnamed protein product [Brassica napus]CDY33175.1 BnaC04g08640D [Brassica napus]VDD06005.1 unnamed protein product [Brassica oleracea]